MKEIQISEIEIVPIKPRNGLLAFSSVVYEKQLFIGDIAIHTSLSNPCGYRLVYPAKTMFNGKRINTVYPINKTVADAIEKAVIGKFEELTEKVIKNNGKTE